jgi:hypothetical protein
MAIEPKPHHIVAFPAICRPVPNLSDNPRYVTGRESFCKMATVLRLHERRMA